VSAAGAAPQAEHPARVLWSIVERIHAVIYFAPEGREAVHAAGVPGFWRAYFAARAAPLGPVPPEVVTALFFGFAPATVARAVPDVWHRCPPERIIPARRAGAAATLERIAGPVVGAVTVEAAAEAVTEAAAGLDSAGRALAAANQRLPVEGTVWERLWQACTTLREHRGDGHVAALVAADLNGIDGHVLQAATRPVPRDIILPARGWSDDDWAASEERLRARGLLDGDGRATQAGHRTKTTIEATTDELAAASFTDQKLRALAVTCADVASVLQDAGFMRFPNPIGLPGPVSDEPGSGL
jgi:hypothetical protein